MIERNPRKVRVRKEECGRESGRKRKVKKARKDKQNEERWTKWL